MTKSLHRHYRKFREELLKRWVFKCFLKTDIDDTCINVKKTTVYTHVNGDRPSHIENSKNKKSYVTISLHIVVRQSAAV